MQVDENCGRLGGKRLLNVALGDDDNNMRDTFELWLEKVRLLIDSEGGGVAFHNDFGEKGSPDSYGKMFFFRDVATKITTQMGLTSNINEFVSQFSSPDSEGKTGLSGLG
jgi:hypothetical protein